MCDTKQQKGTRTKQEKKWKKGGNCKREINKVKEEEEEINVEGEEEEK